MITTLDNTKDIIQELLGYKILKRVRNNLLLNNLVINKLIKYKIVTEPGKQYVISNNLIGELIRYNIIEEINNKFTLNENIVNELLNKKVITDNSIPVNNILVEKFKKPKVLNTTPKIKKKWYMIKNRSCEKGYIDMCTLEEFTNWYNTSSHTCIYCNGYFKDVNRQGNIMSIDRMDNSIGYTIDNMTHACCMCNTIKNSFFTFDQMKILIKGYIDNIENSKQIINQPEYYL